MGKASQLNITNFTIQLDLSIVSQADQVHWQIESVSFFDVTDVNFSTTSSFLNYLLGLAHGTILKMVKEALPTLKASFDALITDFNAKMMNDTQFMLNIVSTNFPLNMTTTKAPVLDNST